MLSYKGEALSGNIAIVTERNRNGLLFLAEIKGWVVVCQTPDSGLFLISTEFSVQSVAFRFVDDQFEFETLHRSIFMVDDHIKLRDSRL